jgi:hypothetical protein
MARFRKTPEGRVEVYTGPSTSTPASPTAKANHGANHDPSPSKPVAKRLRLDSPAKLPPQKSPQSFPVHEGRCCNCTKSSTCSTSRCACKNANKLYRNCDCFAVCRNKLSYKSVLCSPPSYLVNGAVETPSPATRLDYSAKKKQFDKDRLENANEPRSSS